MSKVRVQMDFRPDEVQALEELQEACGLRSRADAVRTALAVVEWMAREVDAGKKIVAVSDRFYSELVIPGLTLKNQRVN